MMQARLGKLKLHFWLFVADVYSNLKFFYHGCRDFAWWLREGVVVRWFYPKGTVLLYRPNGWFVADPVLWVYDGVEEQVRSKAPTVVIRDQRRCGNCSVFLLLATNVSKMCAYHTVAAARFSQRTQFWKVGFERGEYHLYKDAYSSAGAFARSLGRNATIGAQRSPIKPIKKKYRFEREAAREKPIPLPADFALVALQVPGDSVLGFAGFRSWSAPIRRAINERGKQSLLVKHHPMDGAKMTLLVWRALERHVPDLRFMQDVESIELIDQAARVYVCNSGVGYECLCRGVPVVVCARYSDYPSCQIADVDERSEYFERYLQDYSADVSLAQKQLIDFVCDRYTDKRH